jgi:hypothetical protein
MVAFQEIQRIDEQITLQRDTRARHQWLIPVILATQEAEIKRMEV